MKKLGSLDRIQWEYALHRVNPWWGLVGLMCVGGLVLWLAVLPTGERELAQQAQAMALQRTQLLQAPQELVSPEVTGATQTQDLQGVLGQVTSLEHYVSTLLTLAQSLDMPAVTGEYKLMCDAPTRLCRYRVRLPLLGSYWQIKTFVDQSLLALPMASLDELVIRREAIGLTELEASLVFSLHLAYPTQAGWLTKEALP